MGVHHESHPVGGQPRRPLFLRCRIEDAIAVYSPISVVDMAEPYGSKMVRKDHLPLLSPWRLLRFRKYQ